MKFLRATELPKKTGLSYPTIWRKERAGQFPQRRRLGPNSVGWLEQEVEDWMRSRPTVALAPAPEKSPAA
jgi:prophage regulatory protein